MAQKEVFYLESHPHVALNDLLKLVGVADSGGSAKHIIAEGLVSVNGEVELRKTAKIVAGSVVALGDVEIEVLAGEE